MNDIDATQGTEIEKFVQRIRECVEGSEPMTLFGIDYVPTNVSETGNRRIYDRCLARVGDLEAENEQLRELAREMWGVMWACAEQRCAHRTDGCYRVWGNEGNLKSNGECWFEARMAQLGIEVRA